MHRKFDRGAADILEILSTQSALADAWLERIRCQADWRSARLRLVASAGGLGWCNKRKCIDRGADSLRLRILVVQGYSKTSSNSSMNSKATQRVFKFIASK